MSSHRRAIMCAPRNGTNSSKIERPKFNIVIAINRWRVSASEHYKGARHFPFLFGFYFSSGITNYCLCARCNCESWSFSYARRLIWLAYKFIGTRRTHRLHDGWRRPRQQRQSRSLFDDESECAIFFSFFLCTAEKSRFISLDVGSWKDRFVWATVDSLVKRWQRNARAWQKLKRAQKKSRLANRWKKNISFLLKPTNTRDTREMFTAQTERERERRRISSSIFLWNSLNHVFLPVVL